MKFHIKSFYSDRTELILVCTDYRVYGLRRSSYLANVDWPVNYLCTKERYDRIERYIACTHHCRTTLPKIDWPINRTKLQI